MKAVNKGMELKKADSMENRYQYCAVRIVPLQISIKNRRINESFFRKVTHTMHERANRKRRVAQPLCLSLQEPNGSSRSTHYASRRKHKRISQFLLGLEGQSN
ncbi:hypothetical protein Y032_0047g1538 [Ancylostoma ceylanicum]|uniref:Uncharacterized protein n=1 Tax=Ancylostoma ceylanicum TaxID=53326 RepID=A0A016UCB3_9BILA|nr:hypothetical protein Y032_0047g1538 [Ancylostoma ceylanicum]